jgi:salicylate hydroxylase
LLLTNNLATRATASHILGIYSRIRQPLATEVARRSRLNGEHFALRGLAGPDAVSSPRLLGITKQIQDNFEWVSETDTAADLQRAMGLLRTELAA